MVEVWDRQADLASYLAAGERHAAGLDAGGEVGHGAQRHRHVGELRREQHLQGRQRERHVSESRGGRA